MRYNISNGEVLSITLGEENVSVPSRKEGVRASKTDDGAPEPPRREGVPMQIKVGDSLVPFRPGEVPKPEGAPFQTSDMGGTQYRAKSKLPDSETDREMAKRDRRIYAHKKNGGLFS